MKKPKHIGLFKTFLAYKFSVAPSLAGAEHKFVYKGRSVKISLPKKPKLEDRHNEYSGISFNSWREVQGRKKPCAYNIHQVDVMFDTEETRMLKDEWIGVTRVDLFTEAERKSFNRLVKKYEETLDKAYEYWIGVLRWVCDKPNMCQISYLQQGDFGGVNFIELKTEKEFYTSPIRTTVEFTSPIKKIDWTKAQNILSEGKEIPIWQLYYSEAFERLYIGDVRGYVISLAISSETIIRHVTSELLSPKAGEKFQAMVNTIPVSRLIDNWYKLGFDSKGWSSLHGQKNTIKKIFELKNGIMHRGESPELSKETKNKFGKAVRDFIDYSEKYIKNRG